MSNVGYAFVNFKTAQWASQCTSLLGFRVWGHLVFRGLGRLIRAFRGKSCEHWVLRFKAEDLV